MFIKTTKRIISLGLSFVLILVLVIGIIPSEKAHAASFSDINNSTMFFKQKTSSTCTLASAAMMVRRAALLNGNSSWTGITENNLKSTAWLSGTGLYNSFSYAGINVSSTKISSNRTQTMINLLSQHPEGIVIYDYEKPHAILLTDYTNGTFYCADPSNAAPGGRIPISQATIMVESIDKYWYVSSPRLSLTSSDTIPGVSNSNNPVGCLDIAQGKANSVWVRGWAYDPDSILESTAIHVYIGGSAGIGEGHAITANTYRDDVSDVYGVGVYHGFDAEISTSLIGSQMVYVYAINIGNGSNQLIGTQIVNISNGDNPHGCIDSIQGNTGSISIKGWAFDLDDISKPVEIHVYIGGSAGIGEGHKIVANAYRNDVNSVYGVGEYHGYLDEIFTSLYGSQIVYIYAINIDGGNNVLLGSKTVEIACSHSYRDYVTNNNGTHSRKCNNCGEMDVSDCSYNEVVTKPTCTEVGYTTYTCEDCFYSYKADYLDCVGHSFTNYVSDNNATIETDGTKTAYCDYGCGTADTIIDEGSALGTGEPGIENPGNDDLEKPEPDKEPSTTYTYKLNNDKTTITITKCTSSVENIVIPSMIDGYTVTGIGEKAFQNITTVKTILFPSSLKNIGNYAFEGCTSLKMVTLPDSLTELGTYVFQGCVALQSAKLNAGRINISEGLFQGCTSLSSVTLPDTIQYIRSNAFSGCTSLKTLRLPKSLSIVYGNAFLNSGINTIQYAGTNLDWQNVTIGTIGNTSFLNATVIGSNGKTFFANKSKWNTSSLAPVKKPSVSKVNSFKAKAAKKKLTLTWKKLSGAAGYQIQISTKKNFKGAKTISISKSKKTYTKKSLKAKKKYYLRIRAYKTYKDANKKTKKVYGKWTTINKKTK